ncbi:MAG: signal peptidase I [Phenylobacterium sp.]|uniref:signal peptidase I n=1 Tax=Phenylobacterium sp. TaxID=1871053 RepID=UPI0025EA9691|nr:signal peptidase I [Phenylobacterium sp.]MBI1199541.1 signal peptidase I [Phenylobacterium sp.]
MTTPTQAAAPPPARTFASEALDMARTIAWALAIALVARIFIFQPCTIPSDSMEPTVRTGDYILVSKWDYGFSRASIPFNPPLFHGRLFGRDPMRGDVVVFRLPRDPNVDYIKRVIGLPGDRVQLKDGVVYVNGKAIPRTPGGVTHDPGLGDLAVTRYFEPRARGGDYVTWDQGPGHDGDDTGVYRVPEGSYFMLGDNRDNSLDSRWPEAVGVGFVPAENLVGRARLSLISWRYGASIMKPWTWIAGLEPDRFFRVLR